MSYLYRYNSLLLTIILNNIVDRIDHSRKGYVPLYKVLSSSPNATPVFSEPIKKLDSIKINIFKSLIRETKKADCEIFVFVSPIFQGPLIESPTITTAKKICEQEGVTFINFSKSSFFDAHPEYFQNDTHLNNSGAEIYTGMVYKEIIKGFP